VSIIRSKFFRLLHYGIERLKSCSALHVIHVQVQTENIFLFIYKSIFSWNSRCLVCWLYFCWNVYETTIVSRWFGNRSTLSYFSVKVFFLYKNSSFIIIIKEHSVRQQMKHGLVSYLYLNLNPRFHDGNKAVIYHHYLMIECVTMHLIYFSFVEIFSLYYLIIFVFNLYRKCSSTIRYDVYRPNNVSIILISNNSIHKIYLYRRLSLYLLSKREPSDIKWLCVFVYARVLFVNCYVRYFLFLFLIDICSYTSLSLSINQNRTHNCWLICSFFLYLHHRSHIYLF